MSRTPERTINSALRYLASVPFDSVPKILPDDDGETISAVIVYSDLVKLGLVAKEDDDESILYSITPKGIHRLQDVDGMPTEVEF